ncbi:MAG: glycosyltransferase family 4 protein [Flavobacteriales bacterium]|nr:glycosyltransferase family 4 protein [Flavobacteriales bacterium]
MNEKKKYILIVQVTRQLSIDILNTFVSQGCEIELITGVIESNYSPIDQRVKVKFLNRYNNTSTFKRMLTWSIFTFRSFFILLFSSSKKELIFITTPPFIVFIGLIFKKIKNQHYHLVIWDLYPDVLVNFGVLKESSWIIKLWKKLNTSCFNNASTIFTLGKHLAGAIENYSKKPTIIIPNWVNSEFILPLKKDENPFAIKHQLVGKLVIMYSGNMGLTHDIESIVYAAELLQEDTSIQFVLVGDGAKKEKISRFVEEKKLKNVLMLPYQSNDVLPYSLSSADIGVVTLSQGAETISVPSKTYYTLASGSVILALAAIDSELGLLIEQYKCGKVFEQPKTTELVDFIQFLKNNPATLQQYKENARKASFEFTPANAKKYYDYIYGK